MVCRSSACPFRFFLIFVLVLVPARLLCQITIRERIEIAGAPARRHQAVTTDTLPTLRFEYTTCCLFYPTTLFVTIPGGTILTAQGTGGATLTIPNAPGGVYFLRLQEEVGWHSNVWLEAKERIYLDTTLVRSGTYLKSGGPGYVYWYLPSLQTPVKIKISLTSNELTPLGDNDNKANPARSPQGPDKRSKIIDPSKVKTTPLSAKATYHDGSPARSYRLTFRAFGKDETGGHVHDGSRPGGRFLTAAKETVYVMQQRTDSTGNLETWYFCSGFGGVDSIYVRGTLATDTATALVFVKVKDLVELGASARYKLIGDKPQHPRNHFGRKKTIDALKMLADTAYEQFSWVLQYNDISLENGGPYDFHSQYYWNTPHQVHREGRNVDMRVVSTSGDTLNQDGWFKDFVERMLHGKVAQEDTLTTNRHFHLTF